MGKGSRRGEQGRVGDEVGGLQPDLGADANETGADSHVGRRGGAKSARNCLFGFAFGGCQRETMPENADVILLRRFVVTRDEGAFAEIVRRHLDGGYLAAWWIRRRR